MKLRKLPSNDALSRLTHAFLAHLRRADEQQAAVLEAICAQLDPSRPKDLAKLALWCLAKQRPPLLTLAPRTGAIVARLLPALAVCNAWESVFVTMYAANALQWLLTRWVAIDSRWCLPFPTCPVIPLLRVDFFQRMMPALAVVDTQEVQCLIIIC